MISPQQLTIISLQVDKECTGDDSTGVGPIGADPTDTDTGTGTGAVSTGVCVHSPKISTSTEK